MFQARACLRPAPLALCVIALCGARAARAGEPFACCLPNGSCANLEPSACDAAEGLCVGCPNAQQCPGNPQFCDQFIGACCDGSGGCGSSVGPTFCAGHYLGDGTVCTPGACSGACCAGISCNIAAGANNCAGPGLIYQGDGTTCIPNPCVAPGGACCDEQGDCTDVKDEADCPFEGGYQGDGTTCKDPDVCDPQGACCTDTGPQTLCSVVNESQCQAPNQVFQGPDTDCAPDPCNPAPTGACCTDDGEGITCSLEEAAACAGPNQEYLGDGTSCTPDPCNPEVLGACCTDVGPTTLCSEAFESDCLAVNQSFFGPGSSCATDPCAQGACCTSTGVSINCSIGNLDDCLADGQTYLGNGTGCLPDACGAPCLGTSDCADADEDGIRDDPCVYWVCQNLMCIDSGIVFADMGGFAGACTPDGVSDINDRFLALNCFGNTNTLGEPGFPCETAPPAALNVDAGGPFGQCCPDGVCDASDAFHSINAFSNVNPCACPAEGGVTFSCPCPNPTEPPGNPVLCPPGPAPDAQAPSNMPAVRARLGLRTPRAAVRPGETFEVDVYLDSAVADLRGYQLHLGTRGGQNGELALTDIALRRSADHAFSGLGFWQAFNVRTGQMLAGMDDPGVATEPGRYLATFTFRAAPDAEGSFLIEVLHGPPVDLHRTFLFATPPGSRIDIDAGPALRIDVGRRARARRSAAP